MNIIDEVLNRVIERLLPINQEIEIKLKVKLDLTNHAEDREHRPGYEEIVDEEIKQAFEEALPKIKNVINAGQINLADSRNSQICIVKPILDKNGNYTDLNIIGALENHRNILEFIVITIIKKEKFKTQQNTIKIQL